MGTKPQPLPQFRTKTGICLITPEEIILERRGIRGWMAHRLFGSEPARHLKVYVVLGLLLFVVGSLLTLLGASLLGGVFVALGACCYLVLSNSRDVSVTPSIKRSSIRKVVARSPKLGLIRGHFVVHFVEDDTQRRRWIALPGVLEGGASEYRHALQVLQQAGILGETPANEQQG